MSVVFIYEFFTNACLYKSHQEEIFPGVPSEPEISSVVAGKPLDAFFPLTFHTLEKLIHICAKHILSIPHSFGSFCLYYSDSMDFFLRIFMLETASSSCVIVTGANV